MEIDAALAEIEALRAMLEDVCEALSAKAEQGMTMTAERPLDGERLTTVFAEILTLCAFQDLAGQRLTRLSEGLRGTPTESRADAHLLNGPANAGGLDQAAADALFDAP